MAHPIRGFLLPENQRRTLDELTHDLDLRAGDLRAKQTAFWTLLVLSAVIASAGVLSDSTATVIGAMIIAPLSTPIMGVALAIAKRRRNGSTLFVIGGAVTVILIGVGFSQLLPGTFDPLENSQIAGRVSPGVLDMVAALATGLAGSIAMARRDVAAVLPGVAIAISLVPPLAVVGLCLGREEYDLALGAGLLFASNLLAMVLAGAVVFAILGYAREAIMEDAGSRRRSYVTLGVMLTMVFIPLLANTVGTYVLASYDARVEQAATDWLVPVPTARVTGVESHGLVITVHVQSDAPLPPTTSLLDRVGGEIPDIIGIDVEVTQGSLQRVREPG